MSEQPLPFPLPVVPPWFTPQTAAAQNRKLARVDGIAQPQYLR
ncbi:MAG: hypothetical protein G01um101438_686 [Parcubacteria group bacterium Gr01-1014_38]|nr:MAG: hypothetical protein G01um101438_686 [Parcubacteria group bacterium Gr01-1014_38]